MSGRVAHVFLYRDGPGRMEPVPEARALEDHGFEGCGHARPGKKRQLLLIDGETLRDFDLAPGRVKENITTEGIPIQGLGAGARVRVGTAILELTGPCEPCGFMDTLAPGLRAKSEGRRGVLARVIRGGRIAPGDAIIPESPPA